MVAGEGRTPVLQDAHQPTIGQRIPQLVFRKESDAEAVDGGVANEGWLVKGHAAFHADIELAPVLLELSGVEAAQRRQADVDAVMISQVLGRDWQRAIGKIGRGRDSGHLQVRPDPHGDRVPRNLLTETYAGVETLCNDMDEA